MMLGPKMIQWIFSLALLPDLIFSFKPAPSSYIQAVDVHGILPGGFGNFPDHEVLRVEQHETEDVVYITPRASRTRSSCEDCWDFTPWSFSKSIKDDMTVELEPVLVIPIERMLARGLIEVNRTVENEAHAQGHVHLDPRASKKGNVKVKDLCKGVIANATSRQEIDKIELEPYRYPKNDNLAVTRDALP